MKVYPSRRYHPEHGNKLVENEQEDSALVGWFQSPADYGVETCPGINPDPVIAANKIAHEKSLSSKKPKKVSEIKEMVKT